MSAQAHYFKIGLFVIAGTALLVFGLIVLGAGVFFRDRIPLETYINESIQGVDVGTPVKFRGVPIGNVKQVGFVYNVYPEALSKGQNFTYVYIRMEVNPKALGSIGDVSIPAFLEREVKRGLRVGLAPQGLTGQFFLELDYYDPARYPEIPIAWNPQYSYIPSVQSTITYFTDSISDVFTKLEKIDVLGLIDETSGTLHSLHRAIDNAQIGRVSDQAQKTMELVQKASADLSRVLDQPGLADLTSQTQALVVATRRQIETNGDALQGIGKSIGQTAASAQKIAERLDGYMASDQAKNDMNDLRAAIASMRKAADEMPGNLDRTLGKADRMLESQQRNMEQILDNFRQISENLRALSEQAKDYPSQVIFGGPPPPAKAGAAP